MFGVKFPPDMSPSQVVAVHPTQVYEVLMGAIMFFIVLRFRKAQHADGWLFGLYCFLAGIERFIVEFFRAKDDRFFGGFTLAQTFAIVFMLFGATWMAARWRPRAAAVA
jgi:phosphatidylglycerol:prolipoprotein diacylglycerol transferase